MINLSRNNIFGLCSIFVIFFMVLCYTTYDATINNGDYDRSVGHFTPSTTTIRSQPLPGSIPLASVPWWKAMLVSSTIHIFFAPYIILAIATGSSHTSLNTLFFVFSAVYLIGVLLIIYSSPDRRGWFSVSVLLLFYVVFGYLFKSVYEEAATLALVPLFIYSVSARRIALYTLVSIAIIFTKVQMIYLIPFFAYLFYILFEKEKKFYHQFFGFIIVMLAASATLYTKVTLHHIAIANDYNRVYNGFGWALQDLPSWPVNEFTARLVYYEDNRSALLAKTESKDLFPVPELAGTSYWLSSGPERFNNESDARPNLLKKGFLNLLANPAVASTWFFTAVKIAYVSDFRMSYVVRFKNSRNANNVTKNIVEFISANFGYISLIILVVSTIVFTHDLKKSIILAFVLLITVPVFIVAGDGFYEYEKHLAPMLWFFFALPTVVGLAQRFRIETQSDNIDEHDET